MKRSLASQFCEWLERTILWEGKKQEIKSRLEMIIRRIERQKENLCF